MKKEIIRLNTKMGDKDIKGCHRVLLNVGEDQLWSIMLGLERLNLVKRLEKQTVKLAAEVKRVGVKSFNWVE